MQNKIKSIIIWGFIIIFILIILLVMQFTNEVQWNEVIAYIIIVMVIGSTYKLWQWLKKYSKIYRIAFSIGLIGIFFLGWISGAIGIIGSENNPVNLMYWAVPAIGVIGSLISRFKPKGMAYTLFITALVQFLIPVIALTISQKVSWGSAGVVGVFVANFFFVILFVISALLFQYKK